MTDKLGKEAMTQRVAEKMRGKVSKKACKEMIDALHDLMAEQLITGGEVGLHGIGTLSVIPTASRFGVRPGTGEKIFMPPGKKIIFSPSETMRRKLTPKVQVMQDEAI